MTDNEIVGLEDAVERLGYENSQLKKRLDEYASAEMEARRKIDCAYQEAENAKQAASYIYATELKALKMFSDKWRRVLAGGGGFTANGEIIDLLQDFLKDIGVETAKETVEKIDKLLGDDPSGENESADKFEFDLNEAINPSGELDLESLCKELGVFRG